MGLFDRKDSIDELEGRKDRLEIESEVVSKEAEIAEKEAIIAQLKKQYGRNWRSTLGVDRLDLQTLRTFLKTAKEGLERREVQKGNPFLSPILKSAVGGPASPISILPPSGVRKA